MEWWKEAEKNYQTSDNIMGVLMLYNVTAILYILYFNLNKNILRRSNAENYLKFRICSWIKL